MKKVEIPVREKEFIHYNILKATVGTTGYNENYKMDCKTYVKLEDLWGTNWKILVNGEVVAGYDSLKNIELVLSGNAELESFIEFLKFAISELDSRYIKTIEVD